MENVYTDNYHIALHSVAGGTCVMQHIFKTFEKPSKLIKVIPFHRSVVILQLKK